VSQPGKYRVRYWIMMVCKSTLCDTANDYINVEIKTDAGIQIANYTYNNIEEEVKWLEKYIDVETVDMSIDVRIIK
jgi:hypothetical protein